MAVSWRVAVAALALLGPAACLAAPPKPWCDASHAGNYTYPISGIQCRGL
eukprot:COSAG01_NODE_51157_length_357_cov_0.600775_1_plen_49_part_10